MKKLFLLTGGGLVLFGSGLLVGRAGGNGGVGSGDGAAQDVATTKSRVQLVSGDASGSTALGGRRGDSANGLGKSLFSGRGKEPMGELLKDGDFSSRMQKLMARLERADDEDFAAMLDEISDLGMAGVFADEQKLILTAWVNRDPYRAVAYLKENQSGDAYQFAAMAAWAANDPDAAENWARESHEGKGANDWLVGVIQGVAGTDPERAAALIDELPRSREQRQAVASTLPFVLAKGEGFAQSWVEGLESGAMQSESAQWVARRLASGDPEAAAAWVDSLATKEARREASATVAQRYAQEDLSSAKSWVSSLPEDTRTEAAEGVVSVMAADDIRGAVTWLENLGDDPDYDGAWVNLVKKGFQDEPGVALVGALRLSNEGWREKYTGTYLAKWMKSDKAAAQSWVQEYIEYLPAKVARRYVPKGSR